MRHALTNLGTSQFSIPNQTCHNAIINKLLFLDLSRQTLSFGIMIGYNAKAAFDRVINGIANIACQCLGLPGSAGNFMHNLLHDMIFHVITAFGKSTKTLCNSEHPPVVGQGVLQGSSSAGPMFIFTSDTCLSTYKKFGTGATFPHPITGTHTTDFGVQFVDNTTHFTNFRGIHCPTINEDSPNASTLFSHAQTNNNTWNDLIWISGGKLHSQKCYFYSFSPEYNYKKFSTTYNKLSTLTPLTLFDRDFDKDSQTKIHLEHCHPCNAKHTLGVILVVHVNSTANFTTLLYHKRIDGLPLPPLSSRPCPIH